MGIKGTLFGTWEVRAFPGNLSCRVDRRPFQVTGGKLLVGSSGVRVLTEHGEHPSYEFGSTGILYVGPFNTPHELLREDLQPALLPCSHGGVSAGALVRVKPNSARSCIGLGGGNFGPNHGLLVPGANADRELGQTLLLWLTEGGEVTLSSYRSFGVGNSELVPFATLSYHDGILSSRAVSD